IIMNVRAPLIGRKINMAKAIATRESKLIVVLLEPRFQLCSQGFVCRCNILYEKLHLLCHASFYDCVALVQPHDEALTIQDLFLDCVFYHRLKLLWSWRPMPLSFEVSRNRAKLVERNDNLRRRFNPNPPSVDIGIGAEECQADEQEVQEWFVQPAFQNRKRVAQPRLRRRSLRLIH